MRQFAKGCDNNALDGLTAQIKNACRVVYGRYIHILKADVCYIIGACLQAFLYDQSRAGLLVHLLYMFI